MTSRIQRFLGLGLLLAVIIAVVAFQVFRGAGVAPAPTVVRGIIGGEKEGFLRSPEIARILAERHGLRVDFRKAGSIEMVRGDTTGQDFLWPSSQVALELYQQQRGTADRAQVIFNSPIVLYAYSDVTTKLVEQGFVEQSGATSYVSTFPALIAAIQRGQPWSELGLPLYGAISITTTDPTKSNSGNMFAGLLANTLNGGQVVDERTVVPILPELQTFYQRLGFLYDSSGDLFQQFLTQGVGGFPLIAGYESQLIEFNLANPESRDFLSQEINILYPRPTVWSSHPIIALTPLGDRLLEALQDSELQRLAWEQHGFRSGLIGVQNDPAVLDVVGVPATIEQVIPMPKPAVMDQIIAALESGPAGAPLSAPPIRPTTPTAAPRRWRGPRSRGSGRPDGFRRSSS